MTALRVSRLPLLRVTGTAAAPSVFEYDVDRDLLDVSAANGTLTVRYVVAWGELLGIVGAADPMAQLRRLRDDMVSPAVPLGDRLVDAAERVSELRASELPAHRWKVREALLQASLARAAAAQSFLFS